MKEFIESFIIIRKAHGIQSFLKEEELATATNILKDSASHAQKQARFGLIPQPCVSFRLLPFYGLLPQFL